MSIIHSPSSGAMKNNKILVQYSDEIITKSISQAREGKFCPWVGIIGPFQIGVGFRVIGGLSPVATFGGFSW